MTAKGRYLLLSIFLLAFQSHAGEQHPLGMPNMEFCDTFAAKVMKKMPMPYKDFIKLTDGEGMPASPGSRHWDGIHNSYLSVLLVHDDTWVKGGDLLQEFVATSKVSPPVQAF